MWKTFCRKTAISAEYKPARGDFSTFRRPMKPRGVKKSGGFAQINLFRHLIEKASGRCGDAIFASFASAVVFKVFLLRIFCDVVALLPFISVFCLFYFPFGRLWWRRRDARPLCVFCRHLRRRCGQSFLTRRVSFCHGEVLSFPCVNLCLHYPYLYPHGRAFSGCPELWRCGPDQRQA